MRYFTCLLFMVFFISACAHKPSSSAGVSQEYYQVKPDETMSSIAVALEVPYELLRRSNPWLDPARIKPEMKLLIPTQTAVRRYEARVRSASRRYHETGNRQITSHNLHVGHIWPLRKIDVSSHYGHRHGRLHKGIDLRAPRGTPIYASADGVVIFSGRMNGYGNIVVIDHGRGVQTAYAHNDHNIVKKNQQVRQGKVIAHVGRTGKATGYHVHYEFRRHGKAVNPTHHVHAAL